MIKYKVNTLFSLFFVIIFFYSANSYQTENDSFDFADVSLEDLLNTPVVSVTKTSQQLSEAPAIISVITSEDIKNNNYLTVAEALQQVPGIYVRNDLIHPNVSVRGTDSGLRAWARTMKVMIDGQIISYRSDTSNWLGFELIPIYVIDKIEIIRGPGSALYGSNAFLGVINIITKKGKQLNKGLAAIRTGFSEQSCYKSNKNIWIDKNEDSDKDKNEIFNTCDMQSKIITPILNINMVAGDEIVLAKNNKIDMLFAAGYTYMDRSNLILPGTSPHFYQVGNKYFKGINSDIISKNDIDKNFNITGHVIYDTNNNQTLTLDGNFSQFTRNGEFTDWSVLTHKNVISMFNWNIRTSYNKVMLDNKLNLNFSFNYAQGGNTDDNSILTLKDQNTWIKKVSGYDGYDIVMEARYDLSEKNSILIGADSSNDFHNLPSVYSVYTEDYGSIKKGDEIVSYSRGSKQFNNFGIYTQLLYYPVQTLGITLGLRYDNHNIYGKKCSLKYCPALNPRAAIVYNVYKSKDHTFYLKVLSGSSFKAPSAELLYGTPYVDAGITGNKKLKAQTAKTYEIALGGQLHNRISFLINGFYSSIISKVEYLQVKNFLKAINSSDIESYGYEGVIKFKYKSLAAYTNFSWQNTNMSKCLLKGHETNCDQLKELNYLYPESLFNFGITYYVSNIYSVFNFSASYIGERWASQSNRLENLPDENNYGFDLKAYKIPDYFLMNFTVSSKDLKLFKSNETVLILSCKNILNHGIIEPGFAGIDTPNPGRITVLTIKQGF